MNVPVDTTFQASAAKKSARPPEVKRLRRLGPASGKSGPAGRAFRNTNGWERERNRTMHKRMRIRGAARARTSISNSGDARGCERMEWVEYKSVPSRRCYTHKTTRGRHDGHHHLPCHRTCTFRRHASRSATFSWLFSPLTLDAIGYDGARVLVRPGWWAAWSLEPTTKTAY